MRIGGVTLTGVVALCVSACGLSLACAPALALLTRSTFGSPFGSFSRSTGMAVDQSTGNVFVLDSGASDVLVFGPEGEAPVGGGPAVLTGTSTPGGTFAFDGEPSGPAAAGGLVYLADVGYNGAGRMVKLMLNGTTHEYEFVCEITAFGATGVACRSAGTSGGTAFHEPLGVAVDSSGDIYFADYGSSAIYEFNPAGEQVATFSTSSSLGKPQYLAVAANGSIYAQKYFNAQVVEFKRSSPTGVVEGTPEKIASGVTGLAYDNARQRLLLDTGSSIEELNANNEVVGVFGEGAISNGGAVAIDEATDHVYVLSSEQVVRFGATVLVADVSTGSSSKVTPKGATVSGVVNPDNSTVTGCVVEYGTSPALGSSTSCVPAVSAGKPLTGNAPVGVSAELSGVTPGSTYYYRIAATNENGTNHGHEESVTIPWPPAPVVQLPSNVTLTSATLNGEVNPDYLTVSGCVFEYGTEPSLGSTEPCIPAVSSGKPLTGSGPIPVSANLSGLTPGTTYHYRIAVTNEFRTEYGSETTVRIPYPLPIVNDKPPAVNSVTRTGAVLSGTINPQGGGVGYYFEYGKTEAYGFNTRLLAFEPGIQSDAPIGPIVLGELEPATTYHYALVAVSEGRVVTGLDYTFTTSPSTPPIATTALANTVGQNTATLLATVITQGLQTTYGFEIGTEAGVYGQPTGLGAVGAGASEATVALSLTGLQPGVTYHYRITATNADGTSYGQDQAFTTGTFPNVLVTPPTPLPFLAVPSIAFPSEATAPALKKKTAKKKHKKTRRRGKPRKKPKH